MLKVGVIAAAGGALTALALILAPATAATTEKKLARPAASLRTGSFTPAIADPGLAAELARRGHATSFQKDRYPWPVQVRQYIYRQVNQGEYTIYHHQRCK